MIQHSWKRCDLTSSLNSRYKFSIASNELKVDTVSEELSRKEDPESLPIDPLEKNYLESGLSVKGEGYPPFPLRFF